MTRLSIQTNDARCEFGSPVSLIDQDQANRLIGCYRSVIDAEKARALLLHKVSRQYADNEYGLKRFPIATKQQALTSWAEVDAGLHREQYDASDWGEIRERVRAAFYFHYGVFPGSDERGILTEGDCGPDTNVPTNIVLDSPPDWDGEDDDIGHEAIEHEPIKRPDGPGVDKSQGIAPVIAEGPSGLGGKPNVRDPLTGAPGTPPLYTRPAKAQSAIGSKEVPWQSGPSATPTPASTSTTQVWSPLTTPIGTIGTQTPWPPTQREGEGELERRRDTSLAFTEQALEKRHQRQDLTWPPE